MATIRIFETEKVMQLGFYEGHTSRLIQTLNLTNEQAHLLKDTLESHSDNLKATIKLD